MTKDEQEPIKVKVDRAGVGMRIDAYLVLHGSQFSRSRIQKLIESGFITVNNEKVKVSRRLKADDNVLIHVPPPRKLEIDAEDIPLDVVYEDKDIIVINKPAGMVSHPAPGHYGGTLVNALLHHLKGLSSIGGVERPGIVHRLDMDTTGLMMVAKNDKAHLGLAKQIKDRTVEKKYLALVHGKIDKDAGEIVTPIGRNPVDRKKMAVIRSDKHRSKKAVTRFTVVERFNNYALVELTLITGRTHQIRVHLASIGNPVVGDRVYGRASNEFKIKRQLLHAASLKFSHPITGKTMVLKAELPEDLKKTLKLLRG